MGLWGRLTELLLRLVDEYDEPGIALIVFLEEAGVPSPVPGDLLMVLAGLRIQQGKMNLWFTLALLELATVLGATLLYWLAARGGRPLLYRYGRYIHVGPDKLDRAERELQKRGPVAILLGRLIPGLRIATALAAGAFGVPFRVFLLPMAAGAFIYIAVFIGLGMWLGPAAMSALEGFRLSMRAVFTVVAFLALAVALFVLYRQTERNEGVPRLPAPQTAWVESAAMAGFVATVAMGLGVNVLLYALSLFDALPAEYTLLLFAERAAGRFVGGSTPRFFGVAVLMLFVGGVLWALLYARIGVRLLKGPPWLRGMAFSLLPLAVSAFVLLPLFGAGPLGLDLDQGLLPLAGETVRNALFGVALGVIFPLIQEARAYPSTGKRTRRPAPGT